MPLPVEAVAQINALARRLADFRVEDHGSIVLLCPITGAAEAWVDENIGQDNGFQPYWPTVVVEPRYVSDIIAGAHEAGLEVR